MTGSCLCGTVRWRVDGSLDSMSHCHCSMCRKAHGAPFGTYTEAPSESFTWLSGMDAITSFESSPGVIRAFCGTCGSVVPEPFGEDRMVIPAGCLDGDPGVRPSSHIFAASKAPWYVIGGDLPQSDGYINPDDGPNVDRPGPGQRREGVLRGSCLCGDVAYEVRAPLTVVHNCHCSRCRKARAAAHATNGFTDADGVVFVRGEDRLKSFKLPSARIFAQVFCGRCGSPMPRVDRERSLAVVPFGSLDDDPGRGSDDHIFTGSMAPWFTIADELPQFDGLPG